jgi:hypothetical protein
VVGYRSPVNDPYESFVRHRPVFEADGPLLRTSPARTRFFHDQSFPRVKPPGTFRFFAVGGSITRGTELANPIGDCFTALLGRRLAGPDGSRKVEAINLGGFAYGSYRLTGIVEEVLGYSPDLVIVMCGSNEFLEPRHYADLWNPRGSRLSSRLRALFNSAATWRRASTTGRGGPATIADTCSRRSRWGSATSCATAARSRPLAPTSRPASGA